MCSSDLLTPSTARELGLPVGRGVVVRSVGDSSPAAEAGIRAGDVIVEVDQQGVASVAEMKRADAMMADIFKRADASARYRCNFYPGGHKFDKAMQADAFAWFDKHLKS